MLNLFSAVCGFSVKCQRWQFCFPSVTQPIHFALIISLSAGFRTTVTVLAGRVELLRSSSASSDRKANFLWRKCQLWGNHNRPVFGPILKPLSLDFRLNHPVPLEEIQSWWFMSLMVCSFLSCYLFKGFMGVLYLPHKRSLLVKCPLKFW